MYLSQIDSVYEKNNMSSTLLENFKPTEDCSYVPNE